MGQVVTKCVRMIRFVEKICFSKVNVINGYMIFCSQE